MNSKPAAPNLFTWATKELSQDAFICWLLAWAAPEHSKTDLAMHECGKAFLIAMLAKHDVQLEQISTIEIEPQSEHIDILVIVNGEYILLIEDKVHAGTHGTQLSRYIQTVKKNHPNPKLLPLYVKTGSQSQYDKVQEAGYKTFLMEDFLSVLRPSRDSGVTNNILLDFLLTMEKREKNLQAFQSKPIKEWKENATAWIGFYKHLQARLPDFKWGYVPNPSGGFYGAQWHSHNWNDCRVYLQIEQGQLCFKVSVKEKAKQSKLRHEWHKSIMNSADTLKLPVIKRPSRFGKGKWMTAAIIDANDWIAEQDGNLDLNRTLENLRSAEEVLALAVSNIAR